MRPLHLLPIAFAFPVAAFAGTPDGQTPAQEDVCGAFSGMAYGQCVSYCESRDCDDPRVHAADRSCEVTEAKFTKLTGVPMPCKNDGVVCTMDAQDDIFYLNDGGTLGFNVLLNDLVEPTSVTPKISLVTPSAHVSVTDQLAGNFAATWDGVSAFNEHFDYTACCNSTTCDIATVTIIAS